MSSKAHLQQFFANKDAKALYDFLSNSKSKADQRRAVEHLQVLAMAEDDDAISAMAVIEFDGKFVPRNKRRAKRAIQTLPARAKTAPVFSNKLATIRRHKLSPISTGKVYDVMNTFNIARFVALTSLSAVSNPNTVPLIHSCAQSLSQSQLQAFKDSVNHFTQSSSISFAVAYGSVIVFSLMLLVDVAVISKSLIENRDRIHSIKDFGHELKLLLKKDGRSSRMVTNISWLTIAILSVSITSSAPLLMVAGLCLVDIPNTLIHAGREVRRITRNIEAIDARIKKQFAAKHVDLDTVKKLFLVPEKKRDDAYYAALEKTMSSLSPSEKNGLTALCEARSKLISERRNAKHDLVKFSLAAVTIAAGFIVGLIVPAVAPIGFLFMALSFSYILKRKIDNFRPDKAKRIRKDDKSEPEPARRIVALPKHRDIAPRRRSAPPSLCLSHSPAT